MFKSVVALVQATLLAGMTGFAPFMAGRGALDATAMPGMSMPAGVVMGDCDGIRAAGTHGPSALDGAPSRSPSSPHRHHGCCCCMGPCAGCAVVGLPIAPLAALGLPARPARSMDAVHHSSARPGPRLLPFANGPPVLLG